MNTYILETIKRSIEWRNFLNYTDEVFFKALKKNQSYLNSFFRVKADLLKNGLVAYKLNQDYEKVIFLTTKGKELFKKVSEIETLVQLHDEK